MKKSVVASNTKSDTVAAKTCKCPKSEDDRELLIRKTDEIVKRFQAKVPPNSPAWKKLNGMYNVHGSPK